VGEKSTFPASMLDIRANGEGGLLMRRHYADLADQMHTRLLARCWPPDPGKGKRRPSEGRRFDKLNRNSNAPTDTPDRPGLQDARRLDRAAALLTHAVRGGAA